MNRCGLGWKVLSSSALICARYGASVAVVSLIVVVPLYVSALRSGKSPGEVVGYDVMVYSDAARAVLYGESPYGAATSGET